MLLISMQCTNKRTNKRRLDFQPCSTAGNSALWVVWLWGRLSLSLSKNLTKTSWPKASREAHPIRHHSPGYLPILKRHSSRSLVLKTQTCLPGFCVLGLTEAPKKTASGVFSMEEPTCETACAVKKALPSWNMRGRTLTLMVSMHWPKFQAYIISIKVTET